MTDLMQSLSHAIEIVKRLRTVNENVKNAEFANLIADLNMEFADVKLKLAGVIGFESSRQRRAILARGAGSGPTSSNRVAPILPLATWGQLEGRTSVPRVASANKNSSPQTPDIVIQQSEFAAKLLELLPRAVAWAAQQSQLILQSGLPLDAVGLAVARAMGVQHPERIRVWTVVDIPAPTDPELGRFALEQNLIGPGTRGLTLGYGIFVRHGEFDLALLSHECRHVHQVEVVGSLEAFLPAYLKQIAEFGYDHAPYELDARAHELNS